MSRHGFHLRTGQPPGGCLVREFFREYTDLLYSCLLRWNLQQLVVIELSNFDNACTDGRCNHFRTAWDDLGKSMPSRGFPGAAFPGAQVFIDKNITMLALLHSGFCEHPAGDRNAHRPYVIISAGRNHGQGELADLTI